MKRGSTFDINDFSRCSEVKSLCLSHDTTKILVGTAASEIYEISAADGADIHGGAILKGHYGVQIHGLAVHPLRQEYCTAGDDKSVRIFDIPSKKNIKIIYLSGIPHSLAYSPDGEFIVVGM